MCKKAKQNKKPSARKIEVKGRRREKNMTPISFYQRLAFSHKDKTLFAQLSAKSGV